MRAWVKLAAVCVIACGPPSWAGGIHALLASSPRGVRVVEVPEGSPAAKAGLAVDDVIVAIDGKAVKGLTGAQLHDLLMGEVGSDVTLRVDRAGSPHDLRVTRAPYGK
jgi:carboxyl-terminal processing protease